MSCKKKRRVKFILNKKIKHCTKEIIKIINLLSIALFIVMTVIFFKYNLVCSVSISGEHIGYVKNKNLVENQVNEILALEGTNNIAFVDAVAPSYSFTLINKSQEINENEVLAKIKDETKFTYRYYAVTLNNKQESIVNSLEEAEKLVTEINKKYEDSVKYTIGINELYSESENAYETVTVKVAKNSMSKELQKIKDASVKGVYLSQKPVSGIITSRFGNRESIRSYPHTGLDIAAPYGTDIKSACDGKIAFAGYKGSYGNLVIVDCGNGVEIYYGHCSELYVSEGDKVSAGDVIAAVGSTGNSTGNHLHFEIRVNDSQVNPQNYIYK